MTLEQSIVTALATLGVPVSPWGAADRSLARYATYNIVGGTDNGHLRGAGPHRARFQLDLWSRTSFADVASLRDSAKVLLRAGMTIGQIMDNPAPPDPDTTLYRASIDFSAWEK